MRAEPWVIDKCVAMAVGASEPIGSGEDIVYMLHRYDDEWWAMWPNPQPNNLGRCLRTEKELRDFMGGNLSAGLAIGTPKVNYQ